MGKYVKESLPEPIGYYESQGLTFQQRRGKWRTTSCQFHGSRGTMRINTETGYFLCMAGCGARGGDVLAYQMAAHGMGFVEAAKALGAYVDDGKPYSGPTKPMAIPARDLLRCVSQDLTQCALILSDALSGKLIYDGDYDSYRAAAARVIYVAGLAA